MEHLKNAGSVVMALDKAASRCRGWYARHYSVPGSENNAAEFEEQIMGLTRSCKRIIWGAEQNYSMDRVLERLAV